MYSKTIISVSFPKAWEEAVKFVRKSPQRIQFGGGSEIKHAVDSQVQIILDHNAIDEALKHIVHPSDSFCTDKYGKPSENRIMAYVNEYNKDFDASKFTYTYYGELTKGFELSPCTDNEIDNAIYLNLINKLRDGLKFQIDANLPSNRNVITLLNNLKWGMMDSLPCWNMLGIRLEHIDPDGTVWISVSTWYRSHDLTDAWESNFIAQVTMVQKEILDLLNAKILYWSESNMSLHIYEHNLPMANSIKEITINPQLASLQYKYDNMRKL